MGKLFLFQISTFQGMVCYISGSRKVINPCAHFTPPFRPNASLYSLLRSLSILREYFHFPWWSHSGPSERRIAAEKLMSMKRK
jgi:hypothetical protein